MSMCIGCTKEANFKCFSTFTTLRNDLGIQYVRPSSMGHDSYMTLIVHDKKKKKTRNNDTVLTSYQILTD